jgi:pimeloyl-ACP methyl ester carboxylesterase
VEHLPLHIERTGPDDGPALILTHGFGDTADVWRHQRGVLAAEGYQVVTWDLRGHGRSPRPDDEDAYSRDLALGDLAKLVDAHSPAGRPRPVIGGHSLGGYLSLAHAIRRPGRVRGLVLVAAGPGFRDPAAQARWNAGMDRAAARLGLPTVVAGLAHMHDDLVLAGLGAIDVPALLLLGEGDERFRPGVEVLAAKLARARLVVVPGGGHAVHEEHADSVNAAIRAFLADLPSD